MRASHLTPRLLGAPPVRHAQKEGMRRDENLLWSRTDRPRDMHWRQCADDRAAADGLRLNGRRR